MAKPFQLEEATIADIHAAIKAKQLTCHELVQQYLNRIKAYDKQGPSINAILQVNPDVALADQLDAQFAKTGISGPLHCIPVILKDNVNTLDMPTTGGSLSLKGYIPQRNAFITQKLRSAGAIILAKANLHEFAVWGETVSSLGGQTLNPYDLKRTPGGSSGGTAAGIASNFGTIGIGTDTLNSVRSPASANSLVGLRPTRGLISRSGIIPYSLTQDTAGPITRTVTDAAKTLEVIAGYDQTDASTAWNVGNVQRNYTQFLKADRLQGARIGVLSSFFGSQPEHAEVNAVVDQAIAQMRTVGAVIVPITVPDLDSTKLVADVSVHLYELKADLGRYLHQIPPPPVKSLEDIIASGKYHSSLDANLKKALSLSIAAPEYKERLLKRMQLQQTIMQVMAENQLDALVYPHQKRLVVPIGETQVERNGVLAAIIGFPAITVPAGFSPLKDTAPGGVPVGIEFMGRPWSEPTLLGLAYSFEQATHYRRIPKSTPMLQGYMMKIC